LKRCYNVQKRIFVKNYLSNDKKKSIHRRKKISFVSNYKNQLKMNCQLCQKELDAYREGTLPFDLKTQVESHLETCETCKQVYSFLILANKVIKTEKELDPDPFLVTRVMAQIENLEKPYYETGIMLTRILRPVMVTILLAGAVFSGILLGNLSRPAGNKEKIPVELALLNDAALESVDILSNE